MPPLTHLCALAASPSHVGRRALLVAGLGSCCLPSLAQKDAQPGTTGDPTNRTETLESQIKAAFLYKFGSYVEWPTPSFDKADSPFVIGVMAADSFVRILEHTVAGRSMNGRPVVVQRLQPSTPIHVLHILFIDRSQTQALSEAIAAVKGRATLTVTDAERGLGTGCMISFVIDNNKVRFDVAPETAEQSRLKISARLMSVARKVLLRTAAS